MPRGDRSVCGRERCVLKLLAEAACDMSSKLLFFCIQVESFVVCGVFGLDQTYL